MVDTCPEFLSHMEKVQWQNQQILLADRAVHLNDVDRLLEIQRQKLKPKNSDGTVSPAEDTMIHIGDIINQPPTASPAPSSPAAAAPATPSLLSRLAPVLAGAGLLATGAGAGVGIPMLLSAFAKTPTPPVVSPPPIVQEWDNSIKMTVTPP